jgi:hypothetical protein
MVDTRDANPDRLRQRTNAGDVCRGRPARSRVLVRNQSTDNDCHSFHAIVVIPTKRTGGMILTCMIDVSPVGRRERGANATAAAN